MNIGVICGVGKDISEGNCVFSGGDVSVDFSGMGGRSEGFLPKNFNFSGIFIDNGAFSGSACRTKVGFSIKTGATDGGADINRLSKTDLAKFGAAKPDGFVRFKCVSFFDFILYESSSSSTSDSKSGSCSLGLVDLTSMTFCGCCSNELTLGLAISGVLETLRFFFKNDKPKNEEPVVAGKF